MEPDSLNILRDSLALLQDSLDHINATASQDTNTTTTTFWGVLSSLLDVVYKLGMVVIALVNIYFAKKLHKKQDAKEEKKNDSDHKVALLKTLILDNNLPVFYDFFDDLAIETDKLKNEKANTKAIETEIQKVFRGLNEGFIDLLQGIDEDLYNSILAISDNTRETIILSMAEYKLNVEKVHKEHVSDPVANMKKEVIRKLFEFK